MSSELDKHHFLPQQYLGNWKKKKLAKPSLPTHKAAEVPPHHSLMVCNPTRPKTMELSKSPRTPTKYFPKLARKCSNSF